MNKNASSYEKETPLKEALTHFGVVFCPTCKVGHLDPENRLAILEGGECLSCDHLRSEGKGGENESSRKKMDKSH